MTCKKLFFKYLIKEREIFVPIAAKLNNKICILIVVIWSYEE